MNLGLQKSSLSQGLVGNFLPEVGLSIRLRGKFRVRVCGGGPLRLGFRPLSMEIHDKPCLY